MSTAIFRMSGNSLPLPSVARCRSTRLVGLEAGGARRARGLVEQRRRSTPSTAIGIHADMPRRCSGTDTLDHVDAERGEAVGSAPHDLVDVGFRVRVTEAFGQDADPQAGCRCSQARRRSRRWACGRWRGSSPSGPASTSRSKRVVRDRCGHRAEMVEHRLHDHRARVRHQPVRRLHPVEAAERRRHAHRPALVAADRHVDDASGDERGGTRRRAARRVPVPPGVVGRPECVGVAAARVAEVLAVRLAEDRRAGLEHAVDDGGVELGDVTLGGSMRRSSSARPATATLSFTAMVRPASGPSGRAADLGTPVPRVERVVVGRGPEPG